MKKIILALLLAAGITANAQTKGFINANYQTKSIVSGFTTSDKPMIQTTFGFKKNDYSLNSWIDYNPTKTSIRELDINLSGPIINIGPINISGYAGYFIFPNSNLKEMQEIGITPSINIRGTSISNYLSKIFGEGSGKGIINKTTIKRNIVLTDKLAITPALQIAYNAHYFTESKGFSHASLSSDIKYKFSDFSITSKIYYQKRLKDKFNNAFKDKMYISFGIEKEW